ncbi:sensor histidine kinase [Nigerium massiliense]|uniref:sensor histidine kinase n=1 Tax=Nigerium massiliense TaxID=1522317 RepID=UPI00069493EB|nr:histidine kinase [Nigerium massiliense]
MSTLAPTTGRPRAEWRSWLRRGILAVFAGSTMRLGWRIEQSHEASPSWPRVGRLEPVDLAPMPPGVVASVIAAAVALLLVDTLPRWAATVVFAACTGYLVLGGPPFGAMPALAVACAAITRRLTIRRTWPWLLAVIPVYLLAGWDEPSLGLGDLRGWGSLASVVMWTFVPTLIGLLAQGRREAHARARAEELAQAAAAERLRVARDIHDVVGHSLSMISLQSGVALKVLDADPAQARASLEAIRGSSKDALAELRRTLGVFRDEAPLSPTPGLGALPALVDQVRVGGVPVELALPEPGAPVPQATQAVAYRVVQEALTNAVRHAPGASVRVTVRRDDSLTVTVADDGRPLATPPVEGSGLRGMRERVTTLGGTLTVTPGTRGLIVEAVLPLEEPR